MSTRRLLIWCPDRSGIIAAVTGFLAERGANVLDADQHTDPDDGSFAMRLEFEGDDPTNDFMPLAQRYAMDWRLTDASHRRRVAILVSKQDHCLADLLWRTRQNELPCQVACVVSNHRDAAADVATYGIPYHTLPVTPDTKPQQEARLREILEAADTELVILARYMQVLSADTAAAYPNRIINIHHSFLPAFAGAKPYQQAHAKGVKLIGATAHYVTEQLDEGPIISQGVAPVTHRDGVDDLIRKGRDLERTTLAAAVRAHLEDRVIVHAGRTIVFG
ncbi:MAG: formyltetrahydrofolate deformylase [Planctomycetota bacterium]